MKRKVRSFLLLFIILFALLPGYNFWQHAKTYDFKKLFNTDIIESCFNYGIYKVFNKSAVPDKVITGKNTFLFLGNHYINILPYRKRDFLSFDINNLVKDIGEAQKKYELMGIKFISVLAPNKATIYQEYLPDWIEFSKDNITDEIVKKIEVHRINFLDLRSTILSYKKNDNLLYYKQESHWNPYGASIGYEKTIDALNQFYSHKIIKPSYNFINNNDSIRERRDEVDHMKMMRFISSFKELQYYLDIKQKCKINLCDISKENGNIGNCKESDLIPTDAFYPKYSVNNCASNNKKVLLVGDSFLTNTSQLYRATFKEVLQVHFNNFYGEKLQELIKQVKPDIVIYQFVERYWGSGVKF